MRSHLPDAATFRAFAERWSSSSSSTQHDGGIFPLLFADDYSLDALAERASAVMDVYDSIVAPPPPLEQDQRRQGSGGSAQEAETARRLRAAVARMRFLPTIGNRKQHRHPLLLCFLVLIPSITV